MDCTGSRETACSGDIVFGVNVAFRVVVAAKVNRYITTAAK